MDNKLVICIVIFALTLLSYIINKIPMWVTALLSLAALHYRLRGRKRCSRWIRKCQHDPHGRMLYGSIGIPPHIARKDHV
mgnify:CR=1 FL=1